MSVHHRQTTIRSRWRTAVITTAILCFFVLTAGAPVPICAAEDPIKKFLPETGFSSGWFMKEPVTLYNGDTLFDHINGEAELYFPYGFDMLATATYVNKKNPEVWVVVDVYRMDSLLHAFGIYSNYRKADAEGVDIGAEGFVSSSQLMFYQGRYFVRIQVTGATSLEKDLFVACGRAVSQKLPFPADRPRELEVLAGIPGVVTKSERYLAQNLLGYAFFHRGMIADALLGSEPVQVFVVFESSTGAARKAFDDYHAYLKAEGQKITMTGTTDRISLTAVDPLYSGVFVEQSGPHLIGAIRMKETSAVKPIVERMRERLLKQ
jgi:hypothetical protein